MICASTIPTFPSVLRQLVALGERMCVSRETLRRLEKGDPTIAMWTYMRGL